MVLNRVSTNLYQYYHHHIQHIGVNLMYKGEILPNNSIILYDYGSNVSIYCVTDLRPCCTTPEQGEWYDEYHNYWRRGPISSEWISRYNNGTIALHMDPSSYYRIGLHHCRLPNAANITQYIYVGVYYLHYLCKRHTCTLTCEL